MSSDTGIITVDTDPFPLRTEGMLRGEAAGDGVKDGAKATRLITSLWRYSASQGLHEERLDPPNSPNPSHPLPLATSSNSLHTILIQQLERAQIIDKIKCLISVRLVPRSDAPNVIPCVSMERRRRRTDFVAAEKIEIDDCSPAPRLDPAELQMRAEEDRATANPKEWFFAVHVQVPEVTDSEWLDV